MIKYCYQHTDNNMKQFKLYKITQISTGAIYYGIVIKKNKTIQDRFIEHLNGDGSVRIFDLICNGCPTSDFGLELIEEYQFVDDVSKAECLHIRECKANPNLISLNANSGGGFIGKKFFCDSTLYERGWDVNLLGNTKNTILQDIIEKGCSVSHLYRRIRVKRRNSTKFSAYLKFLFDFVSEIYNLQKKYKLLRIYKIFKKFRSNDLKTWFGAYNDDFRLYEYLSQLTQKEIYTFSYACGQFFLDSRHPIQHNMHEINDVFFDHFYLSRHANLLPEFREQYGTKINSPSDTDGWREGRSNFKARVSKGIKTDKEALGNLDRKTSIKLDWDTRDATYRANRTANGVNAITEAIYTCSVCNKPNLSKGNLNRWHNDRCKLNENIENQ